MSVARAQLEISSEEFVHWIAFEGISPGYPEREDLQTALISYTIAQANTDKKSRHKLSIKDFILNFGKSKKASGQITDWKAIRASIGTWLGASKQVTDNRKKG